MRGSQKIFIQGPAGKLEAAWRPGNPGSAFSNAVVLCHPHPVYGGTMQNKVVARTARFLSESGIQTLRFNFRGVGQSEGSWDQGRGERDDVQAAVDFVLNTSPGARLAIAGYSFGAWVGLEVGSKDSATDALVGIAPPLTTLDFEFLKKSKKPKLVVYAGKDQLLDPLQMRSQIDQISQPLVVRFFPDADHFFPGQTDDVAQSVAAFLRETFLGKE